MIGVGHWTMLKMHVDEIVTVDESFPGFRYTSKAISRVISLVFQLRVPWEDQDQCR